MTYFFIISNGKLRYLEFLRTWSLLLSTEESIEGDISHLDDLESDSGNISDGVTLSTKTSNQHLIVLLYKVETTVIGDESSDLLSILDKLYSDTLPDSRVRLLSGSVSEYSLSRMERRSLLSSPMTVVSTL